MDRAGVLVIILLCVAACLPLGARVRRRPAAPTYTAPAGGSVRVAASAPETAGAPKAVGAPVRRGLGNSGASRFRQTRPNVRAIGKSPARH